MTYLHCLTRTRVPIQVRLSVQKMATVAIRDPSRDRNRVLVCAMGTVSVQHNVAIVLFLGNVYFNREHNRGI